MSDSKPGSKISDRALLFYSVLAGATGVWNVVFAVRDRAEWKMAVVELLTSTLLFFSAWLNAGELRDRRKLRSSSSSLSPLPPG